MRIHDIIAVIIIEDVKTPSLPAQFGWALFHRENRIAPRAFVSRDDCVMFADDEPNTYDVVPCTLGVFIEIAENGSSEPKYICETGPNMVADDAEPHVYGTRDELAAFASAMADYCDAQPNWKYSPMASVWRAYA